MNIEALRIFCDVVKYKSFSRAAAANSISQSAATQAVRRLEEHLGVTLLDRSKRPFVLTPEGEICYRGFVQVLEQYDAVERRIRSVKHDITGLVRVGAIYSVGLHLLPNYIQRFMQQYPKAQVRLEYLHPSRIYEGVLNGTLDLGVVSYPQASSELEVVPLQSERMVLACHPEHRLARYRTATAEHLQGVDFVAFDHDLAIRKAIDQYLRHHGVQVRIVMEFDNIETIKQAVEIGAGVSILPAPTVRSEVQRGTLVAVDLVAPRLERPLGIIYLRRKVLSPTEEKFIEILQHSQPADGGSQQ